MTSTTIPTDDGLVGKQARSAVRTAVGVVAGAALAWALKHGFSIDQASADAWLDPLVIGGYNGAIRVLEHRWPAVGWLLGSPRS